MPDSGGNSERDDYGGSFGDGIELSVSDRLCSL